MRLFPDLASVEAFNAKSKKRTVSLTNAPTATSEANPRTGRPSKYGNKKTIVDGIEFDSKKEAMRYHDLVLMQKGGGRFDICAGRCRIRWMLTRSRSVRRLQTLFMRNVSRWAKYPPHGIKLSRTRRAIGLIFTV